MAKSIDTQRDCLVQCCKRASEKRGMCNAHYKRWKKQGKDFDKSPIDDRHHMGQECLVDGCDGRNYGLGYCSAHYRRLKKHGDPLGGRTSRGEVLPWLLNAVKTCGNQCIFWPFSRNDAGYPKLWDGEKIVYAHRLSLRLHMGLTEDPPSAVECRHVVCDNGHLGCINPRHLAWGDRQDNVDDMVRHKRHLFGERHNMAKLNEAQVRAILSSNQTSRALAEEFGVSCGTVYEIRRRDSWGHIEV